MVAANVETDWERQRRHDEQVARMKHLGVRFLQRFGWGVVVLFTTAMLVAIIGGLWTWLGWWSVLAPVAFVAAVFLIWSAGMFGEWLGGFVRRRI